MVEGLEYRLVVVFWRLQNKVSNLQIFTTVGRGILTSVHSISLPLGLGQSYKGGHYYPENRTLHIIIILYFWICNIYSLPESVLPRGTSLNKITELLLVLACPSDQQLPLINTYHKTTTTLIKYITVKNATTMHPLS